MDPIWAGVIGGLFGVPIAVFMSRFNLILVFLASSFLLPLMIFIDRLIEAGPDAAITRMITIFSDPVVTLLFAIIGLVAVFVAAIARQQKKKER